MHHQRSACAATTRASIGQPSHGQERPVGEPHLDAGTRRAGRCAARPSTGSARGPYSTPPRSRLQRGVALGRRPARRGARRRPARPGRCTRPVRCPPRPPAAARARSRSPAPSPAARRRARAPAAGRAACRSSTCSTDADDRLPTAASDRQVSRERRRRQPSVVCDRLEHLRAARVADPPGDVVDASGRGRRGSADVVAEVLARPRRGRSAASTIRKPGAADVPAHHPLGVRVEAAARGRPRADRRAASGARGRPDHDHGRRAVAEQPAGDEVGHRASSRCTVSEHSSTESSTATSSGCAEQVVVQPGDAGRAGDAAEAEDRDPLDVGAQAEPARRAARRGRARRRR